MYFQFANDAAQASQEQGFPRPGPPADPFRVPGDGGWAVPQFLSFSSIVNGLARNYRWTFDEALKHSHANALAMRRDCVVMQALRSRQIPVAQLSWHLEAQDDTDGRQQESVRVLTEVLEAIPNRQRLLMHLLEALWYGRYGVQVAYGWDFSRGSRRMVVRDFRPVNGDKLVYRFSGDVGLLVHGSYKGDSCPTDRGRAHFLTPVEREQFLLHSHEPEDSDFFEGDLAGAVNGVGIRGRVYWMWWLRNQVIAWLMDFLERVGAGGFTIYYYEAGSQAGLAEVRKAAEEQVRNNAILFPRYRDGAANSGPGVQRVEPSNGGAALLQNLVTGYFDSAIRLYIAGETLSSGTASTGLGSGVADLHDDTRTMRMKYDATDLQETLTRDLVRVLHRYNCPPGTPCPRFVFDVEQPDVEAVLNGAQAFYGMGGAVDEDELRGVIGLAKPKPGAAVLAQAPALSPTAVGGVPQGTPMLGTPGPETQAGGTGVPPAQEGPRQAPGPPQ